MRIAILYICTGPYSKLFPEFYKSAKLHLLNGKASLDFFVWTDSNEFNSWMNVKVYPHIYLGFPLDSLLRFEMFNEAKNELLKFDYVYFFNANTLFVQDVGSEILPDEEGKLVCRVWHRPFNAAILFPYERDKRSTAYIPPFDGPYQYFSGGINGGKAIPYMAMVDELAKNIKEDYDNGIIAKVHDESHLNHYFHYHKCKIISSDYSMPQELVNENTHPHIIFRRKYEENFNKKTEKNSLQKIKGYCDYIVRVFAWYFKISIKSGEEKFIIL